MYLVALSVPSPKDLILDPVRAIYNANTGEIMGLTIPGGIGIGEWRSGHSMLLMEILYTSFHYFNPRTCGEEKSDI